MTEAKKVKVEFEAETAIEIRRILRENIEAARNICTYYMQGDTPSIDAAKDKAAECKRYEDALEAVRAGIRESQQ